MKPIFIILIVIAVIVIAALTGLYFFAKKMEKKQEAQQEQLKAAAQTVSILVIDKKRMKINESGLPAPVLESTPKYLRRAKIPIIKAKVGPKVMSLACDEKIFPLIPVKKEVKAVISGIYITDVKGIRSGLDTPQKKKKKGFFSRHNSK